MMRILEVIQGFGLGGAELALMRRLRQGDPHVATTVLIVGGEYDARLVDELVHLADVKMLSRRGLSRALRQEISKLQPDVIVVHNPLLAMVLALPRASQERPVVAVAHNSVLSDSTIKSVLLRGPMRLANRRMSGHIAVSGKAAIGPWCSGGQAVSVCHLGSTLDLAASRDVALWPPDCRIKILVLGRLSRPKRARELVQAASPLASLLQASGAHIAIVGSGPEDKRIREMIRCSHAQGQISMHAAVAESGAIIREADWLVIASRAEGGPLTAYEAALAGTGIASTPVGVLPELLADYPDGILAEGFSKHDLTMILRRVVAFGPTSATIRTRRMRAGSAWATQRLGPQFYRVLKSLVGNKQ